MGTRTDDLTGLPMSAALMERLRDGVGRGEDIALAVLDVDRFKEVNDAYGRETGDRLLQVLAALLAKETPALPHRISGDEFAVLLPDLSLEQAFLRMEALRSRIQGATGLFGVPDGREVTITIGVAQYPRDAKDADGLVKVADAALLAGKESGRNSVGLPPNEEMVMKSCYYPAASVRKLKMLAERLGRKESHLLREALNDVLRKYDVPRES